MPLKNSQFEEETMKIRLLMGTVALAVTFLFTGLLYAANGDLIVNGNLGVGTSTPAGKAEINGSMIVDGNVGIGTSSPGQALTVNGVIQSTTGGIMFPDGSVQTGAATAFPSLSGVISMFGGQAAPAGWLLCDGAAVSRTTYANLFTVIGTTYGAGDGSTTFNLPDFRGIFPKGAGTTNRAAGQDASGNFYSGMLGAYNQDQFQGHYHNLTNNTNVVHDSSGSYAYYGLALKGESTLTVTTPTTDGTNGNPRTGHTTEPQSLGVNFIIKY